jgi:hypothetical protein
VKLAPSPVKGSNAWREHPGTEQEQTVQAGGCWVQTPVPEALVFGEAFVGCSRSDGEANKGLAARRRTVRHGQTVIAR